MQSGLSIDPAISEVLAGDHRKAVEDMLDSLRPERMGQMATQMTCLSADLKSATDLIGHETFQALWRGIKASKPGRTLPHWLTHVVDAAVSPMILEYPDLGRHVLSKRGALMGLPSTWAFLCLANLAWWHKAQEEARAENPGLARQAVRVCGDDLVACQIPAVLDRYEEEAKASGAQFSSKQKHFRAGSS
jgi:hypothetical protein